MDTAYQVQIGDEAVCILRSANTFGKVMNPPILPPAVSKLQGRRPLDLTIANSLRERKL